MERLATGLAHNQQILVGHLCPSSPSGRLFVERVLDVKTYPAIFMYPEGSLGFLRYQGGPGVWSLGPGAWGLSGGSGGGQHMRVWGKSVGGHIAGLRWAGV